MPVLPVAPHKDVSRGDASMEKHYDHTYQIGQTVIHVVAPSQLSDERKEKILNEAYAAAWAIIEKEGRENDGD